MDVIVSPDGRVDIFDVGARMGVNLIGSHIIPLGTGIDYMGNLIRASVGDAISWDNNRERKHVATRLLALRPGKVLQLPDFDAISRKYGVDIYHNLRVGDVIRQYHNNLDGCGYVLATGNCVNDVEQRTENAKTEIDLSIVRC